VSRWTCSSREQSPLRTCGTNWPPWPTSSDSAWLDAAWADPRTRVLAVEHGRALCAIDDRLARLRFVAPAEAPGGVRFLLGVDNDGVAYAIAACWPVTHCGRSAAFPSWRFVEAGESAEQAVAREVHAETAVVVSAVRYLGSQPWPMPQSLMLGFRAEATSVDIKVDANEIAEARGTAVTTCVRPSPAGTSCCRRRSPSRTASSSRGTGASCSAAGDSMGAALTRQPDREPRAG
jgi:NUDIX domain